MEFRKFLRTKVISNRYVHIDYWIVVHLLAGWLLFTMFNLPLGVAIFLIVAYEIIEPSFTVFRKESFVDQLWDVKFGIMGFLIASGGF